MVFTMVCQWNRQGLNCSGWVSEVREERKFELLETRAKRLTWPWRKEGDLSSLPKRDPMNLVAFKWGLKSKRGLVGPVGPWFSTGNHSLVIMQLNHQVWTEYLLHAQPCAGVGGTVAKRRPRSLSFKELTFRGVGRGRKYSSELKISRVLSNCSNFWKEVN